MRQKVELVGIMHAFQTIAWEIEFLIRIFYVEGNEKIIFNQSRAGDKFSFRHPIFRAHNFTCAPDWARKEMGTQNQSVRPIG